MSYFMIFVAFGVIAVVILRRMMPMLASAVALVLAIGVGTWGWMAYAQGGGLALAGVPMQRHYFLGLVALVIGLEVFNLTRRLRQRKREAAEAQEAEAPLESGDTNDGSDDSDAPPPR